MSSILTALKKLEENDFHEEDVHVLSGRPLFGPKKNRVSFSGNSFGFQILVFSLLMALVLVSGIMIWNYLDHRKPAPDANTPEKLAGPSAPAVSDPAESPIVSKPVKAESITPLKTLNSSAAASLSSDPDFPKHPLRPSAHGAANAMAPEVPEPAPPVADLGPMKAEAPASPLVPEDSSMPLEIETTTPAAGYEDLTLQAIAWSSQPADRMAVINGQIVRQGDTFNGSLIEQINENDVVLQKGTYAWRLIFTVR